MEGTLDRPCDAQGRARRRFPRVWPILLTALAAIVTFLVGGFFIFMANVAQFGAHTSQGRADAIVVLTGGQARIDEAFRLLGEDRGQRLLISGVNPAASREALRRAFSVDEVRFMCCVDIDREALDTAGNAAETAQWADTHGFRSLIVVTNDYHMPRSLLEMRRTMKGVRLLPHAVVNAQSERTVENQTDRYRVLIGEYVKYSAAKMRSLIAPLSEPRAAPRTTAQLPRS